MSDTITLTGVVATPPRNIKTPEGLFISSFRLASSQRRLDRALGKWVEGETNWYTVTAFRQMAVNVGVSISKGDRVIVSGRVRVRDWSKGIKSGTNVDIEADSIGHDLSWGTTVFTRVLLSSQTSDHAQFATTDAATHDFGQNAFGADNLGADNLGADNLGTDNLGTGALAPGGWGVPGLTPHAQADRELGGGEPFEGDAVENGAVESDAAESRAFESERDDDYVEVADGENVPTPF